MTDTATTTTDVSRGFVPRSRRRNRLALGVALAAFAIGGNIAVYASLNRTEPAVQVVRDVPAGEMIRADMLRTVEVDIDASVNVIDGNDLNNLVGQYAKVRLVAGSLITHEALQAGPLVSEGSAVVAIQTAEGELPIGLRERVPVQLVIPPAKANGDSAPMSIEGRIVGLPRATDNALDAVSVSIELAADHAATVAAADDVRVVLLVPSEDPAAAAADTEQDS